MKKRALVAALICVFAAGCAQQTTDNTPIPTMGTTLATPAETDAEPTDTESESVTEEVTEPVQETIAEETPAETEPETEPVTTAAPEAEITSISNENIETVTEPVLAQAWTETAMSATMYVKQTDNNTGTVYARERAVIGATPIATYHDGDKVEVIAITDTNYYKLSTGAFIHTDYLTSSPVSKKKKVVTTAEEELIDDGDTAETTVTKKKKSTSADDGSEVVWEKDENAGSTDGKTKKKSTAAQSTVKSEGTVITLGNYTVDYSKRYAYKQLSETEQLFYQDIVNAVMSFNGGVGYRDGITEESALKVYITVLNAEPELFWMSGSGVMAMSSSMIFQFKETDPQKIAEMQKEIDTAAASILKNVKAKKSTINKIKTIYDKIIDINDFTLDGEGYNISIYNGLHGTKKGQLQCAGYAKTVQYLCDMAGVESMVIIGTTEFGSHAWNIVNVDGKYYNFDCTWGDPINSWDHKYIQYEFFLVPDSWIHGITHLNINNFVRNDGTKLHLFDPPACTQYAANYFYLSGIDLHFDNKADADKALKAQVDKAIANGSYVCEVLVTDKAVYDAMMSDAYWKELQKYARSKSSKVDKIKRQASYTKGVQVVHYDIVYK